MGLRFRKSISLIPGVRLNLSKNGASSLSVGGKGLTYNIGKKGTRATGSLPGSGLSYSHYDKFSDGKSVPHEQPPHTIDRETGEITQTSQTPSAGISTTWIKPYLPWLKVGGFALVAFIAQYVRKH